MRNLVCLFLAVLLSVLSASCTKDNPERYTAETAAYCKTRSSTDIPDSYMDLYLIPKKDNLKDYYDGDGNLVPGFKDLTGYDWFGITLETVDQTDDIFNQDYKLINCNRYNVESLRAGYAKVHWHTKDGVFASAGTVKIGTNSVILLARFPVKGWVEVTFEGDIVKYDHIDSH